MIAANVLSKEEFPDFDEETGILPKVDDEEGSLLLELAGRGLGRLAGKVCHSVEWALYSLPEVVFVCSLWLTTHLNGGRHVFR